MISRILQRETQSLPAPTGGAVGAALRRLGCSLAVRRHSSTQRNADRDDSFRL